MSDTSSPVSSSSDNVLRAVTLDGGFRVVAACTTEMVKEAILAQKVEFPLSEMYAELLTATVLLREAMSPDLRLQAVLQGDDEQSRLIADSLPNGLTRGLVQVPDRKKLLSLKEKGLLQIQRSLQNGEMHQGIVEVGSSGSIARAFMAYTKQSEQIGTMISVACVVKDGVIINAGGYLLQLLPEVDRQKLMVMTERLEDFKDIKPLLEQNKASPKELIDETLWGLEYEQVSMKGVNFGCLCSEERLIASLATLPKKDIEELMKENKLLEITCDFCSKEYQFHPEKLRGLLASN